MSESYDMYHPIVMLCGLPGTGKTTYANALGEYLSRTKNFELGMTQFLGYKVISMDSCKDAVAKEKGVVYNRTHASEARAEFIMRISSAISIGYGLVLDDTFKERGSRRAMYRIAEQKNLEILLLELRCSEMESFRRIKSDTSRLRGSSSPGFCPTRDYKVVKEIRKRWDDFTPSDFEQGTDKNYFRGVVHHSFYNSDVGKFDYHYKKINASDQFNAFVDDVRVCLNETYARWHTASPEDTLPVPILAPED